MLFGTEAEQMGMLWDYIGEVKEKNPGSNVLMLVDPETNKFEKLYICLVACKEGFKACRPVIGVDGCHLNGEYGGVLLTAVGVDPNINTYPIAWVVVKQEYYVTCNWFLSLLEIDLKIHIHKAWTWLSDKQKDLCKVFEENSDFV